MNIRLLKVVSKVTDLHAFPWLGVGVSDCAGPKRQISRQIFMLSLGDRFQRSALLGGSVA